MKRRFYALVLALAMTIALAVPSGASSGQQTVYVSNSEELKNALKSNTLIILEEKTYYTDSLVLKNLQNVTIRGQGDDCSIVINPTEGVCFSITLCENIVLDNFSIGNTSNSEPDSAFYIAISKNILLNDLTIVCASILNMDEKSADDCITILSSTVSITNCFVLGLNVRRGLWGQFSDITVQKTTFGSINEAHLVIVESSAFFQGCSFSHGGIWHGEAYPWAVITKPNESLALSFSDCKFENNYQQEFILNVDNGSERGCMYTLQDCVFTDNNWSNPTGTVPYYSTIPPQPAAKTAYASTQEIEVDGKKVTFEAYALKDANGNDTNYVKLRDVASVLNGTPAQFEVGWNGSVTITTGRAYTPNGSEMHTPYSGDRSYQDASAATVVNGTPVELPAILLTDDAGSGYTYYQLRELGAALGFKVDWSAERGIFIQTN